MCCCKLLEKECPQAQGSQRSMPKARTRQVRRGKLVRVSFACDRPKDDATSLSSPQWWHSGDGPYWAGLTDWAHNVQGCWSHGRTVLDTPLQAGECGCSHTDRGYVFHNLEAGIIPCLALTAIYDTHRQTAHHTSVCPTSFRCGWSEYLYSSSFV